jgi:hypothetical protein
MYEKRIHINRAVGGYCYHRVTVGNSDARDAEGQGSSEGNCLQIKFEERGIGRTNVP